MTQTWLLVQGAVPHLGGGADPTVSFIRIVVSLAICLIVAVLAILLIRQRGGGQDLTRLLRRFEASRGRVEVIETRRLSLHADICLLRHDDREYLLLLQANGTRILKEADLAARAPDPEPCG